MEKIEIINIKIGKTQNPKSIKEILNTDRVWEIVNFREERRQRDTKIGETRPIVSSGISAENRLSRGRALFRHAAGNRLKTEHTWTVIMAKNEKHNGKYKSNLSFFSFY